MQLLEKQTPRVEPGRKLLQSEPVYSGITTIVPQKSPNVKRPSAVINAERLLKYAVSLLVEEPWNPQVSSAVDHCGQALDALQKEPHA